MRAVKLCTNKILQFLTGEPVPERYNQSGFYSGKRQWVQWHQLGRMQVCTSLQTSSNGCIRWQKPRACTTTWYFTVTNHTHPFNGPLSGTTQVSRYQKGKTNLDFTEARDSEWQWHQLGHMQVCTLFQTDNHASTSPLSFLLAGCPSCRPTNNVNALKAKTVLLNACCRIVESLKLLV